MGFDFQKQILLLIIIALREIKQKATELVYSVGMEQKVVGLFDDIVIKYSLPNGQKGEEMEKWICVQVKHSAAELTLENQKVLFVIVNKTYKEMIPHIKEKLKSEFGEKKASQAYAEFFTWASSWLNDPGEKEAEGIDEEFSR
ncbi:hypothetical protein B566_EDAN009096, partial [Ephemera danica]